MAEVIRQQLAEIAALRARVAELEGQKKRANRQRNESRRPPAHTTNTRLAPAEHTENTDETQPNTVSATALREGGLGGGGRLAAPPPPQPPALLHIVDTLTDPDMQTNATRDALLEALHSPADVERLNNVEAGFRSVPSAEARDGLVGLWHYLSSHKNPGLALGKLLELEAVHTWPALAIGVARMFEASERVFTSATVVEAAEAVAREPRVAGLVDVARKNRAARPRDPAGRVDWRAQLAKPEPPAVQAEAGL